MPSRKVSPLKENGDEGQLRKKLPTKSMDDQGLRTLIQHPTLYENHKDSNVVLKSGLRLVVKPIFILNQINEGSSVSCFLEFCHLCNKTLSLDKEAFMYRGDQGFCSEQCRDRQIYLDEIRKLEICSKKTVGSYRSCMERGRNEATLRRHYKHIGRPSNNDRVIFSLS